MDKPELSPCRACGKEISTNLYEGSIHERRFFDGYSYVSAATTPQGCPNCGEADPHGLRQKEEIRGRTERRRTERSGGTVGSTSMETGRQNGQ